MRFLLLILLVGCASAPIPSAAQQPAPADLPSATLPAELDRVLRDYERNWRAGNEDSLAALFTEDGFALSSGRPPIRGRAAIREGYASSDGLLHLRALESQRRETSAGSSARTDGATRRATPASSCSRCGAWTAAGSLPPISTTTTGDARPDATGVRVARSRAASHLTGRRPRRPRGVRR